MDVVANAGSVGGRVIRSKHLHVGLLTEWNLEDIGDDMRFLPVMFAKLLRTAGGIEIAQADVGESMLLFVPVENAFEHQLRFTVRIDGVLGEIFGDRYLFRNAEDGAGGGEDEFANPALNAGLQ